MCQYQTVSTEGFTPPVCAKVRLFNTTTKCFRAGLVLGKLLIL